MASTITNSTTATTAASRSALQEAAQSIISGATHSALDVNALVKAMVNAKTAGPAAALAAKQSASTTTVSALGTLKSALASLQTSLEPFKAGAAAQRFTATTGEQNKGLSAVAGKDAVASSFSIEVDHLATAQKLSTAGFATGETLGAGNLDIAMGGKSMHLSIDANHNSLASVAAAINRAKDNPGITASVVAGADGQHLVLTGNQTGAANAITVSAGAGLDARLDGTQLREVIPATDAALRIDGNAVTSASNTLDGVITGITIQLESAAAGTTQTLTVAPDTEATGAAIRDFVKAYNSYVDALASLTAYTPGADASTTKAGVLLGDSIARTLAATLPAAVAGGAKGSDGVRHSLGEIGISLDPSGKLQIDDTAFKSALQPGNRAISALFGNGGMTAKLNDAITPYVRSSGLIDHRTESLGKTLADIKQQQTRLEASAALLTTQFNRQFTALNTLMTTMNNNQQYLTQLFGGANSAGALATNRK